MPETKVNIPEKQAPEPQQPQQDPPATETVSPTRFGDWEKNGRCIDF